MKKEKMRIGGRVNNSQIKNYIETPAEALAENQISIAKALYEANTDPLYLGLKGLGNLSMQAGLSMGGFGQSGGGQAANQILPFLSNFAFGGEVSGDMVEVEGEEVVETPGSKAKKVKGPSHENGGIDLFLPGGTEVYSKRISVGGETMADRKLKRDRELEKIEKALERNPTDKISKDTYERSKEIIDREEEMDMNIQMIVSGIMGSDTDKAQFGLPNLSGITNALIPGIQKTAEVDIPQILSSLPQSESTSNADINSIEILDSNNQGVGFGDLLSIGGDLFSTFAPLVNTLRNRAGDTPNTNEFRDFGKDAIEDIQAAQNLVDQQRDDALDDINLSSRTARSRNRANSRSANTQRATDLAIEQQANRQKTDVYNQFANQMMNLLLNEAQFENVQDQAVMSGEQARDLADRQDRDAFSTNIAKNLSTIGQGLQETGKDVNAINQNEIIMNLLNQLSSYGLTIDNKGNVS